MTSAATTINVFDDGFFDEGKAVASLLLDDVVFVSAAVSAYGFLCVSCNDVFMWGAADSEALPYSQIRVVYDAHQSDKEWGAVKWVCKRRNEQPQEPVKRAMIADGVWDSSMDALQPNRYENSQND